MQWPPTSPGLNLRKFHLLPAACSTSCVSISNFSKRIASSFTRAMFRSRWVFSITFAATPHLISELEEGNYDAIIVAVAHSEFREMGISKMKTLGKENSVVFDVKHIFPGESVDGSL